MASSVEPERSASASHDEVDLPKTNGDMPSAGTNQPKPGLLKKVWTAIGLDVPTVILMLKGSLPPVIAIAA